MVRVRVSGQERAPARAARSAWRGQAGSPTWHALQQEASALHVVHCRCGGASALGDSAVPRASAAAPAAGVTAAAAFLDMGAFAAVRNR